MTVYSDKNTKKCMLSIFLVKINERLYDKWNVDGKESVQIETVIFLFFTTESIVVTYIEI